MFTKLGGSKMGMGPAAVKKPAPKAPSKQGWEAIVEGSRYQKGYQRALSEGLKVRAKEAEEVIQRIKSDAQAGSNSSLPTTPIETGSTPSRSAFPSPDSALSTPQKASPSNKSQPQTPRTPRTPGKRNPTYFSLINEPERPPQRKLVPKTPERSSSPKPIASTPITLQIKAAARRRQEEAAKNKPSGIPLSLTSPMPKEPPTTLRKTRAQIRREAGQAGLKRTRSEDGSQAEGAPPAKRQSVLPGQGGAFIDAFADILGPSTSTASTASTDELNRQISNYERCETDLKILKALGNQEELMKKAETITESKTGAWKCLCCKTLTLYYPKACQLQNHTIQREDGHKKFYLECGSCGKKRESLTKQLSGRCEVCGEVNWKGSSLASLPAGLRKYTKDEREMATRGEEVSMCLRGDLCAYGGE